MDGKQPVSECLCARGLDATSERGEQREVVFRIRLLEAMGRMMGDSGLGTVCGLRPNMSSHSLSLLVADPDGYPVPSPRHGYAMPPPGQSGH